MWLNHCYFYIFKDWIVGFGASFYTTFLLNETLLIMFYLFFIDLSSFFNVIYGVTSQSPCPGHWEPCMEPQWATALLGGGCRHDLWGGFRREGRTSPLRAHGFGGRAYIFLFTWLYNTGSLSQSTGSRNLKGYWPVKTLSCWHQYPTEAAGEDRDLGRKCSFIETPCNDPIQFGSTTKIQTTWWIDCGLGKL